MKTGLSNNIHCINSRLRLVLGYEHSSHAGFVKSIDMVKEQKQSRLDVGFPAEDGHVVIVHVIEPSAGDMCIVTIAMPVTSRLAESDLTYRSPVVKASNLPSC
jgi:hypothetical protein